MSWTLRLGDWDDMIATVVPDEERRTAIQEATGESWLRPNLVHYHGDATDPTCACLVAMVAMSDPANREEWVHMVLAERTNLATAAERRHMAWKLRTRFRSVAIWVPAAEAADRMHWVAEGGVQITEGEDAVNGAPAILLGLGFPEYPGHPDGRWTPAAGSRVFAA